MDVLCLLQEVDVPVISGRQCEAQLQQTRLGYDFKLHNGFLCAGGEEGKDACKVYKCHSYHIIILYYNYYATRLFIFH